MTRINLTLIGQMRPDLPTERKSQLQPMSPKKERYNKTRHRAVFGRGSKSRPSRSRATTRTLRLNPVCASMFYQQPLKGQADEAGAAPVHLFTYGERLRFLAKISAPRNYRNPGAFDYRGYLLENGIVALASTNAASVEILPGFAGNRAELWRSRLHRSIIEKVHARWPSRQADLMDAMVIGEDAFINRSTRADFQRSGTYHGLVVSGMNVSILALMTFWFLRRMRVSDFVAGAITVALMVAYALITGLGAPVWRATLMLALYLGARLLYREKSMLNAIGAAAMGLMIVNPQVLFAASFQLTFLCVWLVAAVGIPDSGAHHAALCPRHKKYQLSVLRLCSARAGGAVSPRSSNDRRAAAALCRPPHSVAGVGAGFPHIAHRG